SCATVLNKGVQKISITSSEEIDVVSIDSSLKSFNQHSTFYLERSKKPVTIELQLNTVRKKLFLKSHNSIAYWANIFFNYGIGMLVDKDNPKRFDYPRRIYIQKLDSNIVASRFSLTTKGAINWHIALPHVNFFYVATQKEHRSSEGFWGLESGLDYFYMDGRFISVYGGVATDFFVPVPAAVDIRGEYQSSTGIFVNVRNNHRTGSFDFGYGLAYSRLSRRKTNNIDSTFIPEIKRNSTVGLSLNSSYRFGELFQLGLLYQPYFIRFDNKVAADYQHQISIELIWKIPLRR